MSDKKKIIEKAAIVRHLLIVNAFYLLQGCLAQVYAANPGNTDMATENNLSPEAYTLVKKVFDDLDQSASRDYHVHILGLDRSGENTWVNPRMFSWAHPFERFKTMSFMKSTGIRDISFADTQYIDSLVRLIRGIEEHGKYHILGHDHYYNPDGTKNLKKSEFYA